MRRVSQMIDGMIFGNLTTNERINMFKYHYLRSEDGSFGNPFDQVCTLPSQLLITSSFMNVFWFVHAQGKLTNFLVFFRCKKEIEPDISVIPPENHGIYFPTLLTTCAPFKDLNCCM
jgi:hypothetical protein